MQPGPPEHCFQNPSNGWVAMTKIRLTPTTSTLMAVVPKSAPLAPPRPKPAAFCIAVLDPGVKQPVKVALAGRSPALRLQTPPRLPAKAIKRAASPAGLRGCGAQVSTKLRPRLHMLSMT